MDSWEFLQRKLADLSTSDIPSIMLSGSSRPAGAIIQLAKRVDIKTLLTLIHLYC
jgi:hypothetical protein